MIKLFKIISIGLLIFLLVTSSVFATDHFSGDVTVTKMDSGCAGDDACMIEYTYMIYGKSIDADTAAVQVREHKTDEWRTISIVKRGSTSVDFTIGATFVSPSMFFRVLATTNGEEWEVPIEISDLTANRLFLPIVKK